MARCGVSLFLDLGSDQSSSAHARARSCLDAETEHEEERDKDEDGGDCERTARREAHVRGLGHTRQRNQRVTHSMT